MGGAVSPPRRLSPLAVRRWRLAGVRPNLRHLMALLDLTDSLGLGEMREARRVAHECPTGSAV